MRTARPKSLLERTADTDLWRHTLSQIPTISGRLVYLATLRSPITGRYEHHGLALLFGEEASDKAIRMSHRRTFQEWLTAGLEEKTQDILGYIETTGEEPNRIVQHWLKTEAWVGFAPNGLLPAERSLYVSDMRNSIRILAGKFVGAAPDRGA